MSSRYVREIFPFGKPFALISLASVLGIVYTKKGKCLRAAGSISYTRMHDLFLAKWRELGYDTASLGLHSLRAGGSSAAANAGIGDRLLSSMDAGNQRQPRKDM